MAIWKGLLAGTVSCLLVPVAFAQQDDTESVEEVVVVGSQIKGSDIAGALPVTVLSSEDIEVTGVTNGEELLRSIPQIGAVTFNESSFTGVNGARGDIGSINLRGIGTGNTLVLLNGRRLVLHPGTQVEDFVPVVTVNSNALPITGIERLEVLRDGAAAIYGTDAVAGVINTITQTDYEGLTMSLRNSSARGSDLDEWTGTLKFGRDFNEGRSNFSIFANFLDRSPMAATDREYSGTEDLRPFFEGTPFEGDTQLRNLSTQTQFAEFRALDGEIAAIGDDDFHIQPSTFDGCLVELGNGVCADNGGSIDTDLRLNRSRYRQLAGNTERQNLMAFLNHEYNNGITLFSELTYYHSDYNRVRETAQVLSSGRFVVPADAFYNPFGVDLEVRDYRALDAGQRSINVENDSYRVLGGLRGNFNSWDWESAVLHSESETQDVTNRMSTTLFQQAISRTTEDAYNIFAGGDITDTNAPNTSANSQATIDSFIVPVSRISSTSLTLADFKLSNGSVRSLPAGELGMAVGIEFRREDFEDDRDARLDGTIQFTDAVTGNVIGSDVVGSSPTPDTRGDRNVTSAYVEFAVPLISDAMDIPLVDSLDAQLAIRAEDYSDVGSVVKPKVALSWYPHPDLQVRAAYSEGFRAPNLEQINANGIRRVNGGREDWITCEAAARANATDFDVGDCDGASVESVRSGGPDLQPEENDNVTFGLVYQPSFISGLTLTLDWWKIEQTDVVGIFGDQNQISLDYLLRVQGSSNPNVVRADPDADAIALFTAAGLTPAGEIIEVRDSYTNLTPREFKGIDFGVQWSFDTRLGGFDLGFNSAFLDTAFQEPSPLAAQVIAAVASGEINEAVDVPGSASLIEQNGRPEWRSTASVRWRKNNWGAGAFYNYVGEVVDTSVTGPDGEIFIVDSFDTLALYGEYTFDDVLGGPARIRVGARNVFDEDPPIADEFASGYFDTLHTNRGRFVYVDLRKDF